MWLFFGIVTVLVMLFVISAILSKVMYFVASTTTKKTALEKESEKLARSQRILFESEKRLQTLQTAVHDAESDVKVLKAKIKGLLPHDETAARVATANLLAKEADAAYWQEELRKTIQIHEASQATATRYQLSLRRLHSHQDGLAIERGLVELCKDEAGFQNDLTTNLGVAKQLGSQEQEIAALQAKAEVDRRLAGTDDFVSAGRVEERLSQLRCERENQ